MCLCLATGFSAPHDNPLLTLSPGAHNQHNFSSYSQLSHHAFQQYPLGGIQEGHSLNSDSGLVTGGALWNMENSAQPIGSYSGSPGHQQSGNHAGMTVTPPQESPALPAPRLHEQLCCWFPGVGLIEEHLREVRCLRQRLEESIRTNERLRQQLEEKLATNRHDGGTAALTHYYIFSPSNKWHDSTFFYPGAPTNIYIQGLDTVTQLSNEIRLLKDENTALQTRLKASTGPSPAERQG